MLACRQTRRRPGAKATMLLARDVVQAALTTLNEQWIDALARVLADAKRDDAKIDVGRLVVRALSDLEPAHIAVLQGMNGREPLLRPMSAGLSRERSSCSRRAIGIRGPHHCVPKSQWRHVGNPRGTGTARPRHERGSIRVAPLGLLDHLSAVSRATALSFLVSSPQPHTRVTTRVRHPPDRARQVAE